MWNKSRRAFLTLLASLTTAPLIAGKPQTQAVLKFVSYSSPTISFSTVGTRAGAGKKLKSWSINWGDGQLYTFQGEPLAILSHNYAASGTYTVELIVTDSAGFMSRAFLTSSIVVNPPTPIPSGTVDPLAYGPQSTITCPGTAVHIAAGTDIMTVVNAHSAGTIYCLGAGYHRQQTITPKNGDQFWGDFGAIVTGAKILTGATADGSDWRYDGQTQDGGNPSKDPNECYVTSMGAPGYGYPECRRPNDLWIDGVLQVRVSARADLAAGRWYFDLAADKIYIRDNPSGKTVETSTTVSGVTGSASTVLFRNISFEHFANESSVGAFDASSSTNWTVQYCEFTNNHGIGLRIGNGITVENCDINYNYQLGIGGTGTNALIRHNEIHHNNVMYNYGWEGGGSKFTYTSGLILRDNFAHHNFGPGLWLDIDNLNFLIEDNICNDNDGSLGAAPGIMIEISWGGTIRNNTCNRNGLSYVATGYLWAAGILIAASGGQGLEIYGNTVLDNGDGITLIQQARGTSTFWPAPNQGSYLVQNVNVHDNIVRQPALGGDCTAAGAAQDAAVDGDGGVGIFSRNNHFEANIYTTQTNTNYFAWNGAIGSFAVWQAAGHDTPVGSCTTY